MYNQLTDKQIQALKPRKHSYYIADAHRRRGTGSLVLKIQPSGRKTFFFRYNKNKKKTYIQLGDYPNLKLTRASQIANSYSKQLSQGINPKDYIAQEKAALAQLQKEQEEKQ